MLDYIWDSRLIAFSLKGAVGVPIELLVGAMVRAPYFYSTESSKDNPLLQIEYDYYSDSPDLENIFLWAGNGITDP